MSPCPLSCVPCVTHPVAQSLVWAALEDDGALRRFAEGRYLTVLHATLRVTTDSFHRASLERQVCDATPRGLQGMHTMAPMAEVAYMDTHTHMYTHTHMHR